MENNNIVLSSTTLKTINELLDSKSVSELRKMAPKYGIKSASKYRRPALVSLLADAIEQEYKARLVEEQAKQPKASKPTKKYDYKPDAEMVSKQVEDGNTYLLGIHALGCVDDRDNAVVVLVALNRQALIRLMKSWGVKGWYRIYDKATMIDRLLAVAAA